MQQGDESDAHVQIQHKSTVSYSTLSKCLILCRYSNHTHTHTHTCMSETTHDDTAATQERVCETHKGSTLTTTR